MWVKVLLYEQNLTFYSTYLETLNQTINYPLLCEVWDNLNSNVVTSSLLWASVPPAKEVSTYPIFFLLSRANNNLKKNSAVACLRQGSFSLTSLQSRPLVEAKLPSFVSPAERKK